MKHLLTLAFVAVVSIPQAPIAECMLSLEMKGMEASKAAKTCFKQSKKPSNKVVRR